MFGWCKFALHTDCRRGFRTLTVIDDFSRDCVPTVVVDSL